MSNVCSLFSFSMQVFYNVTLYVLKKGSLNLSIIIPIMDLFDEVLTNIYYIITKYLRLCLIIAVTASNQLLK